MKTDATKPVIEAGNAHFENLKPGTVVNIFTVDGRRAGSATATATGIVDISLKGMSPGVYILTTPSASYKIYNR